MTCGAARRLAHFDTLYILAWSQTGPLFDSGWRGVAGEGWPFAFAFSSFTLPAPCLPATCTQFGFGFGLVGWVGGFVLPAYLTSLSLLIWHLSPLLKHGRRTEGGKERQTGGAGADISYIVVWLVAGGRLGCGNFFRNSIPASSLLPITFSNSSMRQPCATLPAHATPSPFPLPQPQTPLAFPISLVCAFPGLPSLPSPQLCAPFLPGPSRTGTPGLCYCLSLFCDMPACFSSSCCLAFSVCLLLFYSCPLVPSFVWSTFIACPCLYCVALPSLSLTHYHLLPSRARMLSIAACSHTYCTCLSLYLAVFRLLLCLCHTLPCHLFCLDPFTCLPQHSLLLFPTCPFFICTYIHLTYT